MRRIVITGGPGVGKTTTLDLLAQQGYATVPEAARDVIAKQQEAGDDGLLPWTDFTGFQYLVLDEQLRREREANGNPLFLDRGIVDALGYCAAFQKPVPHALQQAVSVKRYSHIFLLNQLPNYQTDAQRKEDPVFAKKIHEAIGTAYESVGYTVHRVPVLKPEQRVEYILDTWRMNHAA